MKKTCTLCGDNFEATSQKNRYCSSYCLNKAKTPRDGRAKTHRQRVWETRQRSNLIMGEDYE